jgi:pyridoxamine 5'-phosphate oxidase
VGQVTQVEDKVADQYYNSRGYDSRIGAWASKQSTKLVNRDELVNSIKNLNRNITMKKMFQDPVIGLVGTYLHQVLNFG